jgi:glycosyltransferase involved in cell wall biosynthesis
LKTGLPRVSVLMPFYNAEDTLPECLPSIIGQTLADFELIAVDDGSTDASAQLIMEAARDDPRIRLISPGRVGLVAALNIGAAACRSPLIARMDADDIMLRRRLELQVKRMESDTHLAAVGSRVQIFPPEALTTGTRAYMEWLNTCIEPEEIAADIYVEAPLAHPSVVIRRTALEMAGYYRDGDFPEDYDLWLRMHAAGLSFAKVPETLLLWRDDPTRASRTDLRYRREAFDVLRARYLAADPRLTSGRELVAWGAGRRTRRRVERLLGQGIKLSAWIDIDPDKIEQSVWGLPVHPPEWLAGKKPFVLVYVAVHGAREDIAGRLSRMGYRKGEDFLHVG